jgi:hypothetical protein
MPTYKTAEVSEFLDIPAPSIRRIKNEVSDAMIEGQHYFRQGRSLLWTAGGIDLLAQIKGNPFAGLLEDAALWSDA